MQTGHHVIATCILALTCTLANATTPPPPQPQRVATDTWLIPGSFPAEREPDGNTVIFVAPAGLIVMDTGRHTWHTQAILDFARARWQPIVAIINITGTLDHTSGNAAIKQVYPRAKIYTATSSTPPSLTSFRTLPPIAKPISTRARPPQK